MLGVTPVDDLAAWLTQVWDEQEKIALDAAGWDRSGSKRAIGEWARVGVSSIEDALGRSVIYSDSGQVSGSVADHIAANDPALVLVRIAADRQILALHQPLRLDFDPITGCSTCSHRNDWEELQVPYPCPTVRLLAQPQADRPGFEEAWRVTP